MADLPELYQPTLEEILTLVEASTKPTYGVCGSIYSCVVAKALWECNPWLREYGCDLMVQPNHSLAGGVITIFSNEAPSVELLLRDDLNQLATTYDRMMYNDHLRPARENVIALLKSHIRLEKGDLS